MTLWVTKEILMQENIKQRCAVIQRMLDICKICLKLNNYVTVFQITSALISTPVQRLHKTWDLIPPNVSKNTAQKREHISRKWEPTKFLGKQKTVCHISVMCPEWMKWWSRTP